MGENQVQQGLYSQSFEHDNCGIGAVVTVGDGTCQSLADDGIQGSGGIAPRVQQGTDDDTDKQRGIYFFGNQRQRDCDDRGKQCPSCRLSTGCVRQDKRCHNDAQRNGKRDDRGDGSQAGV